MRDIEQVKTSHYQEKTGETIKHLHVSGIKYFGISGESGAFLKVLITCKK